MESRVPELAAGLEAETAIAARDESEALVCNAGHIVPFLLSCPESTHLGTIGRLCQPAQWAGASIRFIRPSRLMNWCHPAAAT